LSEVESVAGALILFFVFLSYKYSDLRLYEKVAPGIYNFKAFKDASEKQKTIKKYSLLSKPSAKGTANLSQMELLKRMSSTKGG